MRAIEILVEEHEVIKRHLIHLEFSVGKLCEGVFPPVEFFEDALALCRELADRYHHDKEENVLFALLLEKQDEGLLEEVRRHMAEHEEVRAIIRGIADLLEPYRQDPAATASALGEQVMEYVHTLRCHIRTEDEILFPMAEEALTGEEADAIYAAYAKFGPLGGEALTAYEDRVWAIMDHL